MDKKTSGVGKGLICNTGGDKQAYLGHFRSAKNMERGHNFGWGDITGAAKKSIGIMGGDDKKAAPHRPTKKQLGNEAWRGSHKVASAKADVRAAKKSGDESAIQAAKTAKHEVVGQKKEALKTVRGASKAYQEAKKSEGGGTQRTAKAALQTARATAKEGFKGALQQQDARRAAKKKAKSSGGGLFSKMTGGIL